MAASTFSLILIYQYFIKSSCLTESYRLSFSLPSFGRGEAEKADLGESFMIPEFTGRVAGIRAKFQDSFAEDWPLGETHNTASLSKSLIMEQRREK